MPSPPPQPLTADTALHAHFEHVKDARTEDCDVVTDKTTLAALYMLDNPEVDNNFLSNTTGVCKVKVRCQILSDFSVGSGVLPPTAETGRHGFDMFCTFNLLAIAPSLRIEAHFIKHDEAAYVKLALEFAFNDRLGKQLQGFRYRADDTTGQANIRFSTTGATSEGFTLISGVQHRFGQDEKEAVSILQSLAAETGSRQLRLVLQTQEMLPSERSDFQKLVARLPGGQGHLFPSIGVPEWSNYPIDEMRTPKTLMTGLPPNPMVPLDCPNTFHSMKHFETDHLSCAVMAQWETETVLSLFAMCEHKVALYGLKGLPVLAMSYGAFPKNAIADESGMRIPNDLEIKVKLSTPGVGFAQYTAVHDQYLQGLPKHDAYFPITSHKLSWFNGEHLAPEDDPKYHRVLELIPHPNSFLIKSLTAAVVSLDTIKHRRFHPIALGQSFDSLKPVDITAEFEVSDATRESAWNWLMNYEKWNAEQLQLIRQLKCAKGGVCLATGTAGTGKTTVQMAMAVYFVKMGGRAACFATSNSNVVTQAGTLHELAKAISGSKIRVIRIVSTSRGVGFQYLSETQALAKKVGHDHGIVSTIYGLQFMRHDQRAGNLGIWVHTVEACMLEEADRQQLIRSFQYRDDHGRSVGPSFNAWSEFRRYLDESLASEFWEDEKKIKKYAEAFEACMGHLIGLADIIITTNGNAQCTELKKYWAGVNNIKGLGVFIDEVGKEQEISVWNSILSAGLPRVPEFVMLLGDPKQLAPVNTSVTGALQCNAFAARGDVSMLDRLIALGYPYIHLHLQQRMHPALWAYPSAEFYDTAEPRSAPGAQRTLEDVEPGLKDVLDGIIAKSLLTTRDEMHTTDDQIRLQYLNFGVQPVSRDRYTRSVAIPGHIQAVFDLVLPGLQQHFGDRTYENVMIIAAYGNAVGRYLAKIHALTKEQGLSPLHYPHIMTVNSAQGQEAKMVILDNSMQHFDRMGFTTDRHQANVAMTRAKEVFWIVGGPLTAFNLRSRLDSQNAFPKLKKKLSLSEQVQIFSI